VTVRDSRSCETKLPEGTQGKKGGVLGGEETGVVTERKAGTAGYRLRPQGLVEGRPPEACNGNPWHHGAGNYHTV
jgi:hypothetical protein